MSILDTARNKAQQIFGSAQKQTGKTFKSTRHADQGRVRRGVGKVKEAGNRVRNRTKRAARGAKGRPTA